MRENNIDHVLSNLSPEDLGEILDLIKQKAGGDAGKNPTKKRKQKRRNDTPQKQRRKKHIIIPGDEEEIEEEPQRPQRRIAASRSSGRRTAGRTRDEFDIHAHRKMRSQGRGNKGTQCRAESMGTGHRQNVFDKMGLRNAYKADTKIDKLLRGNNEPIERRPRVEYIEAQCCRCKQWFENVLPSQLFGDAELGSTFICDACSMEKSE